MIINGNLFNLIGGHLNKSFYYFIHLFRLNFISLILLLQIIKLNTNIVLYLLLFRLKWSMLKNDNIINKIFLFLPSFWRCFAFHTFFGKINLNLLKLIIHQHCKCENWPYSFLWFNSNIAFKLIRNHFADV